MTMIHHHSHSRPWPALVIAAVCTAVIVAAEILPIGPWISAAEANNGSRCGVSLGFYNKLRRVKGAIGVECGRWHSAPWGNWGVESRYGGRRDSFQFAGWKLDGGLLQWNSCTLNHKKYRAPNALYYNDNNYRTQKAAPDDTRSYASHFSKGPRNWTCAGSFGGVHTYRNVYMALYELDPGGIFGGGDDRVTSLYYGTIHVAMTCQGAWRCRGVSSWKASSYNTKASAEVRIIVNTSQSR